MQKSFVKGLFFALTLISFGFAHAEEKLGYGKENNRGAIIDIADYEGQTFLAFMQDVVKPALDGFATEGYKIADGNTVLAALENVDDKVREGAIDAAGGKSNLKKIADTLHNSGETYSLYNLPEAISDAGNVNDRYDLSTFLGLASGGGVAVKFNEDNYAYNIHYGTGNEDKDVQTGRSFGASKVRDANDASDAAYLRDLQKYSRTKGDVSPLYRVMIEVLTNCDVSGYDKVSDFGGIVLTDFLAVYIAEQDRNLMQSQFKDLVPWWDASLLEVTLLSYFHAGQDKTWVMFMTPPTADEIKALEKEQKEIVENCINDGGDQKSCERKVAIYENSKVVFTDVSLKQEKGGTAREQAIKANMVDYWQFSFTVHKSHRGRSGINITKPAFRALGKEITAYERKNNPELVEAIEQYFPSNLRGGNVYEELSQYLINSNTPSKLGADGKGLAKAFEDFLNQVYKDANTITESLKKNKRYDKAQFPLLLQDVE